MFSALMCDEYNRSYFTYDKLCKKAQGFDMSKVNELLNCLTDYS